MTFDLLQEKLENSQKKWKRKIWFAFNPKTGLPIISRKCFWNRFAFVYMILKKLFAFNLESDLLFISTYDLWPSTMKIGKLFAFNPESDLFFIYVNLKKLKREALIWLLAKKIWGPRWQPVGRKLRKNVGGWLSLMKEILNFSRCCSTPTNHTYYFADGKICFLRTFSVEITTKRL